MRKNYFFLLMILLLQVSLYGQNHTHVYSKLTAGNAWAGPISELGNFTTCQSSASLTVNGFNWAGWAVTYNVEVNGIVIATDLDGQFSYDLTDYLPVETVKMIATSGSGWIEMQATLSIDSPISGMPVSPIVSNLIFPYGVSEPLTATLTGTGTRLKFYTMQAGDIAPITAVATNTPGTFTYWVSQADASGCESVRVPMQVTIAAPENIVHVIDGQCGTMLPTAGTQVVANIIANAQGYRFRVTDIQTGNTQVRDCNIRTVQLCNLPNFNYDHAYSIEVAVKRNGVWSGYGLPCNVYTPMAFTKVKDSQCGSIVKKTDLIYADIVPYAKGYAFNVTNWNLGESYMFETTARTFSLSNLPGYMYSADATYAIQVAAKNVDGNYLPFGQECIVSTTQVMPAGGEMFKPAAVKGTEAPITFTASGFPNPFANEFKVSVQTESLLPVTVKIYDMLGRMIESRQYESTGLQNITVGHSATQSGIFNVVVSQGESVETLRMIRR